MSVSNEDSLQPFFGLRSWKSCKNFEVTELLKFWTEKIVEIDPTESERPSLGLILEKMPEIISLPRSDKKVELKQGGEDDGFVHEFGDHLEVAETFLMPTSPCDPDGGRYGAGEIVTSER